MSQTKAQRPRQKLNVTEKTSTSQTKLVVTENAKRNEKDQGDAQLLWIISDNGFSYSMETKWWCKGEKG